MTNKTKELIKTIKELESTTLKQEKLREKIARLKTEINNKGA